MHRQKAATLGSGQIHRQNEPCFSALTWTKKQQTCINFPQNSASCQQGIAHACSHTQYLAEKLERQSKGQSEAVQLEN